MPITDWPKTERPREKLLTLGANSLSDAELLAIFLRTGIKGKTAVDLARDIISHFGGLRNLLIADQKTFCQFCGLGPAKFAQLQAVVELSRRHLKETLKHGEFLQNPQATQDYLSARLRDLPYEVFACLFLDNQHRVIEFEILFQGTANHATDCDCRRSFKSISDKRAGVNFTWGKKSRIFRLLATQGPP